MQTLSQQRYEMFNQTYSDTDFQQLKQEYELAQKYADPKVQARDISVRNTDGKSGAALQDVQQQMYDIADELSKTYGLDINADGAEQVIGDLKEQMLSLSGLSSVNIDIMDEQAKKKLQDLKDQLAFIDKMLPSANGRCCQRLDGSTKRYFEANRRTTGSDRHDCHAESLWMKAYRMHRTRRMS